MKLHQFLLVVMAAVAISALQGCAHGAADRKLDQKVEQEPTVTGTDQLRLEAKNAIDADKNLSSDQKTKLKTLLDQTKTKMTDYRNTSLKLRSILIKDLSQADYDTDEVDLIKCRLRKIEGQRLSLLFDVIDQVNATIGRKSPQNEQYLRSFFDVQHSRRD